MPYIKKFKKRTYKKRSTGRKPLTKSQVSAVKRLAQSQALKTQETKCVHRDLSGGLGFFQMFHNTSKLLSPNLLASNQGVGDDTSLNVRIGDEVTLRGVKLNMLFKHESDRPNVTVRLWVVKTMGQGTVPIFAPFKNITGNVLLDQMDTEAVTVVATRTFKFKDNYWEGSSGSSKELTFVRKLWVPLKNQKYTYGGDDFQFGKKYQLSLYAACYDSVGTLTTDNIMDMNVYSSFYFKDA